MKSGYSSSNSPSSAAAPSISSILDLDIAELLYQCKPDSLEQHLNITLDRQAISEYTDNNFNQLNNRGLQLDDSNFLDNLTDVVEQQMLQTINLNDYINENSNNPDIRSRFAST